MRTVAVCLARITLTAVGLATVAAPGSAQCDGAKLIARRPAFRANFGIGVSVFHDVVAVGAQLEPERDFVPGAAYLFRCSEVGTNPPQRLVDSKAMDLDLYGYAISASTRWCAVGSPLADEAAYQGGAVTMYDIQDGTWVEHSRLLGSGLDVASDFGESVSLHGHKLLVGARTDSLQESAAGRAFLFELVGDNWEEVGTFVASDGDHGWWFGGSVDLSGSVAVVGAWNRAGCVQSSGAAYVFEPVNGAWVETARLCGADVNSYDHFGRSVSVSGETILVGAPHHNLSSTAGAVYVFEKQSSGWVQTEKILPPESSHYGPLFGESVAVEGDLAVIGASFVDGVEPTVGAAYVYERSAGAWVYTRKLQDPDGETDDLFGQHVDLSSGRTVVSAVRDEVGGHERAGSAWVFEIGVGQSYCAVEPNSSGSAGLISAVGSASVAANDLTLSAVHLPEQTGIFFAGSTQLELPFGNGWRCVGGQILRLRPRQVQAGILRQELDLATPPLIGTITPGSSWNFQAWYRDPMGGGSAFNTSNALAVGFLP